MRNYKLILQYEGTRYQGWQRQESTGNTIQGRLEALLTKMTGAPVEIQGSGRTDAGVHALGQVANFHADISMRAEEVRDYMNRYLPEDIAVIQAEEVPERFHSRLNARGKTYRYQIVNGKVPAVFGRRYSWHIEEPLDTQAMKKAAGYLTGTHDFQSFTSAKKGKKSTIRTIDSICITTERCAGNDKIILSFSGDGFLYHMVRILTGTLVEVGKGLRAPEDIPGLLEQKDRQKSGALAPAQGLTLVEVRYEMKK